MSQDLLEKIKKAERESDEAIFRAEEERKKQVDLKEKESIELLQNLEKSLDLEIKRIYQLAEKKSEEINKKEEERRDEEIKKLGKIKKDKAIKFILENLENLIKL